jgi:predicted metal-dependent hydrolase
VRVNRRARRLLLKVRAPEGTVELTLPRASMRAAGLAFLAEHSDWIAGQRARLPDMVTLADGIMLPLRGRPHRVRHEPAGRGIVTAVETGDDAPLLLVRGRKAHLGRRLRDWLKAEARADLTAAVDHYAASIGAERGRISIRDTRSQWGSCSARGSLSFSWRLVLAPIPVAAYVAAHECAHLRHRDHGDDFWRLVAELCPDFQKQRRWLRENGQYLHRFS